MKHTKLFTYLIGLVVLGAANAVAQSTAFTYQGQLRNTSVPANGYFDLQFNVFSSASGGTALTAPITLPNVEVSNGVFSVQLDFGAGVFPGADRWLAIGVRPAGDTNAHTILTPRQIISSVPYAIRALTAGAAAAVTGPIADSQLSVNIPRLSGGNLSVLTGNIGIGTSLPAANLHIRPNVAGNTAQPTFIRLDMTGIGDGSPNSLLLGADGPNFFGTAFIDTTRGGVAAPTPLSFRIDGVEKMRIAPSGNVGIGTLNPGAKLDVSSASGGSASGIRIVQAAEAGTAGNSYVPLDFTVPTTGLMGQLIATANKITLVE